MDYTNPYGQSYYRPEKKKPAPLKVPRSDYIEDESLNEVQKQLHNFGRGTPYGGVLDAMGRQAKYPILYKSPISERLYRARNPGIDPTPIEGQSRATPGSGVAKVAMQPDGNRLATAGYYTQANHEAEHATRQGPQDKLREIGPSVGNIVFSGEQFAMEQGQPLDHTVQLPGGVQHDINWMRERAREHGYWDGRSMHDLIMNTPEGRQWLGKMRDGLDPRRDTMSPPLYPSDIEPPRSEYTASPMPPRTDSIASTPGMPLRRASPTDALYETQPNAIPKSQPLAMNSPVPGLPAPEDNQPVVRVEPTEIQRQADQSPHMAASIKEPQAIESEMENPAKQRKTYGVPDPYAQHLPTRKPIGTYTSIFGELRRPLPDKRPQWLDDSERLSVDAAQSPIPNSRTPNYTQVAPPPGTPFQMTSTAPVPRAPWAATPSQTLDPKMSMARDAAMTAVAPPSQPMAGQRYLDELSAMQNGPRAYMATPGQPQFSQEEKDRLDALYPDPYAMPKKPEIALPKMRQREEFNVASNWASPYGYRGPTQAEQLAAMEAQGAANQAAMDRTRAATDAKWVASGVSEEGVSGLRPELNRISAAWRQYKRDGGKLGYNDWAYAYKAQGGISDDASKAMALNAPGVFKERDVNSDLEDVRNNPVRQAQPEPKKPDPYSFRARVARAAAMGVPTAAAAAYYANADMAQKTRTAELEAENAAKLAQEQAKATGEVDRAKVIANANVTAAQEKAKAERELETIRSQNRLAELESANKMERENRLSDRELEDKQWWDEQYSQALQSSPNRAAAVARLAEIARGSSRTIPDSIKQIINDPMAAPIANAMEKIPEGASKIDQIDAIYKAAEASGVDPARTADRMGVKLTPSEAEEELKSLLKDQIQYGYNRKSNETWMSTNSPARIYEEAYKQREADNARKHSHIKSVLGEDRYNEIYRQYTEKNRPGSTKFNVPWYAQGMAWGMTPTNATSPNVLGK